MENKIYGPSSLTTYVIPWPPKIHWNQLSLIGETWGNQKFGNEGWSVYIQGGMLAKMSLMALYKYDFGEEESKPYWMTKHSIAPQLFTKIQWDACKKC
jgi:hypothetical protein